jgi:hypothetical protein
VPSRSVSELGAVAAALEAAENAGLATALRPFSRREDLQPGEGNWASSAKFAYFDARRFLTLGALPGRVEGVGDSDTFFFPS